MAFRTQGDNTKRRPFKPRPAEPDHVILHAPDHITGCAIQGEEHQVGADGTVEVPHAHVAELLQHGFRLVPFGLVTPAPVEDAE